jgi:SAM-dependent methyltransferase
MTTRVSHSHPRQNDGCGPRPRSRFVSVLLAESGERRAALIGADSVVVEGVQTWHYGLMARWWAEFATDGPEIDFFRRYVEVGQPALDLACGTGRLLVPFVEAGLDVDGVDVSPDMLAHCAAAAARIDRDPALYCQALHQLQLPRRYRTVFVCGGFGIGGSRDDDVEGLRRMRDVLEPGGLLAIDVEMPYADAETWAYWTADGRRDLPEPERSSPGQRRLASDGCEYASATRVVALDPVAQQVTRAVQIWQWRDGVLVASEHHTLTENLYFPHELTTLLETVGFADIQVVGGYHGGPPTADDEFLIYLARRP